MTFEQEVAAILRRAAQLARNDAPELGSIRPERMLLLAMRDYSDVDQHADALFVAARSAVEKQLDNDQALYSWCAPRHAIVDAFTVAAELMEMPIHG